MSRATLPPRPSPEELFHQETGAIIRMNDGERFARVQREPGNWLPGGFIRDRRVRVNVALADLARTLIGSSRYDPFLDFHLFETINS